MTKTAAPKLARECANVIRGSDIAIVVDVPGEHEVGKCKCSPGTHAFEPCVGESGKLLRKALVEAGINIDECDLLYLVGRRLKLKGNKKETAFEREMYHKVPVTFTKKGLPKKHEIRPTPEFDQWSGELRAAINANEYKVVIPAGTEPLKALCQVSEITKYRGSVLKIAETDTAVVPIIGTKAVIKGQFKEYWILINDLKKAKNVASGDYVSHETGYKSITAPTIEVAVAFLNAIGRTEPYAIDIETRQGALACLSLAAGDQAICVPLQNSTGPYYTAIEEATFWRSFGKLLSTNPNLVGQNLTFDLEYLYDYGVEQSGILMDTMVGHNLLFPEFPKGLDFLCSVYLNVPYYKDEGKTWNSKVPDQQLWDYNNKDAIYTLWIAKQIQNLLHEKNLWSKYEDLLRGSLEIALEMQRTRLRRSYHESQTIQSILKDEIQTAHGEVKRLAQREINVVSPKQVGDLLFHDMGLAQPRGYGSGRDPSTDENQLKLLYAKTQEPVLSAIIKERHLRKRWSSYIDIIDDPDGYLPFGVNVAGTESGRWSMKKSVRDRGFNAQTCPKIMRWAYCPPPGRIYLQPDLSQAEARVVAWLSECQPLIDIFLDPRRNIHSEIAALVFGHEVEKDSLEYTLAKSMVHASNYRMGAGRFAAETGLSYAKAAKLLEAFHARFPEIRKWHDSIRKRVVETGRLVTPTGRNRTFYDALGAIVARGKMNDNLWREAISYIPQATVADLTNQGMQAAWRELGNGALFHNQSHDSFLLSVRPDQVGKAARIIQRSLHLPLTIHGRELIIPSDLAIGYNWYMLKQYEGEESYHYGDWKRWENKEWQRHAIKTGGSRSKYIAAQLSGIY